MNIELLNNYFSLFEHIAIILASFAAVYGINSWRRETKWKRKYELAEEVLSLFYLAQHKLRIIRSPAGWANEGESRKKDESKDPKETKIRNQAYVVIERFEKESEPFYKLQSLKFRFITIFGKDKEFLFDELNIIVNEIFWAAQERAEIYLNPEDYLDFKEKAEKLRKIQRVLYESNYKPDEDLITKRINELISKVEKVCNQVFEFNNQSEHQLY